MIAIFLVGCFMTAIVSLACWLVVTGIREDSRSRENLAEEGINDVKLQ